MSSFDFMHPEDLDDDPARTPGVRAGRDLGESNSGTLLYRGRHRNGSWRWLEANGRLFCTASGEGRSAAVIRDVTDRQAAQKAMERRLENQKRIANLARDLLALGVDGIDAGRHRRPRLAAADLPGGSLVAGGLRPARGLQQSWEWSADGVPAAGISMDGVDLDEFPHTREMFRDRARAARSLVRRPSIRRCRRRAFLRLRRTSSLLAIPLLSGSDVVGAVGFETVGRERSWSDETIALLRLGGEVFVSAISRKRAEEALRESRVQLLQAQKMEAVGTLAGGVAHDFNNQLSVILGNARFVRAEVEGDEELQEAMADLERAGEHCAQLTRSLLSFSRHMPAEPQATSVSRVLLDVQELTGPLLSSGIRFEVQTHDELDCVYADRTQLQQVLVNLVVNARDAMPDGGESLDPHAAASGRRRGGRASRPARARRLRAVHRGGHGLRDGRRDPGPHLRALLHHQGSRQGHGARAGDGLRHPAGEPGDGLGGEQRPGWARRSGCCCPAPTPRSRSRPRAGPGGAGRAYPAAGGGRGERAPAAAAHAAIAWASRCSRPGRRRGAAGLGRAPGHDRRPGERCLHAGDGRRGALPTSSRTPASLRVLLVTGRADDDVSVPGARLLCKPFRAEELSWALQALLAPT